MDAVITWVDGSDPAHQAKMAPFLAGFKKNPISASPTRFADCGEIEFCVMSIIRFAPWIENIYIITDSQQPQFYTRVTDPILRKRIRIIDHREIFRGYEYSLPLFNSLSIEAMLWNISDLSDDFIYLNDDMMFVRPTPVEAFRVDNKYVLKGQTKMRKGELWWHRLKIKLLGHSESSRVSFRQLQENSAAIIDNSHDYLDLPHCPHILNRHILRFLFQQNFEMFKKTISYKFRHPQQIWSVSLFVHYVLAHDRATMDSRFKTSNIKANKCSKKKLLRLLNNAESKDENYFLCVQSLDLAEPEKQNYILQWLKRVILDSA